MSTQSPRHLSLFHLPLCPHPDTNTHIHIHTPIPLNFSSTSNQSLHILCLSSLSFTLIKSPLLWLYTTFHINNTVSSIKKCQFTKLIKSKHANRYLFHIWDYLTLGWALASIYNHFSMYSCIEGRKNLQTFAFVWQHFLFSMGAQRGWMNGWLLGWLPASCLAGSLLAICHLPIICVRIVCFILFEW